MSISPKVSAATVGATLTTMTLGIVGPHMFPSGMPTDVQGLISAGVAAAVTFTSGYLARHDTAVAKVETEVKQVDAVYTKIRQAPVAELFAQVNDRPEHMATEYAVPVASPVAVPVAVPLAVAHPLA